MFLGVIRLVEEQERDVSSEISHLVTMVKNLPDSLRVKRLIGEIQNMLEAAHGQVHQRGLSQAMLRGGTNLKLLITRHFQVQFYI